LKIRVTRSSIRYRLTQTEVADLALGKSLDEELQLAISIRLLFSIEPKSIDYPEWDTMRRRPFMGVVDTNDIKLKLPLKDIETWANSDQEGLYYRMTNGTDKIIEVTVEKDFACLKPRVEEVDQFPNPNKGKMEC
jgi:hypothetical protein